LTVKSRAIRLCEPRQVRKEAALSKSSYVPRGRLARANCFGNAWEGMSTVGARILIGDVVYL